MDWFFAILDKFYGFDSKPTSEAHECDGSDVPLDLYDMVYKSNRRKQKTDCKERRNVIKEKHKAMKKRK